MLRQVRSLRGTLASKTRESLFSTFGESSLPSIKTNAGPSEISIWKRKPEVKNCFDNLFEKVKVDDDMSPSNITQIIEKVFSEKKYSKVEMAYVVAICTTMLDPNNDELQLKEEVMKRKVKSYLVRFLYTFK